VARPAVASRLMIDIFIRGPPKISARQRVDL
jgi:hypothetical protein